MKTILPILALSAMMLTGCKTGNPGSTVAINQSIAFIGASIALQETPEARGYLAAATPIICQASGDTNTTPEILIGDLGTIHVDNPYGPLLVNTGLALWLAYRDANDPEERLALLGVCRGFSLALGTPVSRSGAPLRSPKDFPHVKVR